MEFVQGTLGALGLSFSMMYAAWPLVLVAPFGRRRRYSLGMSLALWVSLFAGFLATLALGARPVSFLISEPWNTYLFFGSGTALVGAFIARRSTRRRAIRMTADKARSPQDLLRLSPTQFENMVVDFYQQKGAKAWRTGATGDHGIDVVVETPKGEKWVVQCKRWRGSVGEPQVRDFYGAVQHEKADRGVLVTTGTFSSAARAWAQGKPLVLADGKGFLRAWRESAPEAAPSSRTGRG